MTRLPKIALEEHFMTPGFERYSKTFLKNIDAATIATLSRRLADIDSERLALMDAHGIELVVLSQTGPGVQAEENAAGAAARARETNDYLAERIARHPKRFRGFAALPMQDPELAIRELERTVRELGFVGAMVNGHTAGSYYDDRRYDAFWQRLQQLEVPFYLHPADAPSLPGVFAGHPELHGAAWGWGVETGTHALRLLFGGVFDRFPGVRVVLGHMGEGLPFLRWRFDSRFAAYPFGLTLKRKPSEYIGSNIVITTSGVCSHGALVGAVMEMGAEAVMFSVDYPYEDTASASQFIETAPLTPQQLRLICRDNAARLFKLS
jgi:2,3-dihydroxybenzoate decarboxylase